jgi:hypothetical protein
VAVDIVKNVSLEMHPDPAASKSPFFLCLGGLFLVYVAVSLTPSSSCLEIEQKYLHLPSLYDWSSILKVTYIERVSPF